MAFYKQKLFRHRFDGGLLKAELEENKEKEMALLRLTVEPVKKQAVIDKYHKEFSKDKNRYFHSSDSKLAEEYVKTDIETAKRQAIEWAHTITDFKIDIIFREDRD